MCNLRFPAMDRGFSLIEVLIAVVVLSVGLLALAALQSSLIRFSADAKAQSVALSLAKEALEDMRSYQDMDEYRALTSRAQGSAEQIDDDSGSLGGVSYQRWWTVTRYAFNETTGTFEQVANTGALDPDTYPEHNEFKTVTMHVAWNDVAGVQQRVVLQDAIGALSPMDSSNLQANRSVRPRGPEVLIYDPSNEAGVIPIAIGSNTETAATNPRPEIAGRNNTPRAVETRFDVLTYSALTGNNSGLAQAQARVETSVVGCTCDTARAGSTNGFRPTYWNGERYVPPARASTYLPPAGHAALGNNDPPESRLCEACCRDHHDPIGVAGPKFSPARTTHEHYLSTNLTNPIGSGRYNEACRLIRVDGIFRVAADLYNDYFNLLETSSVAGLPLRSPIPSEQATSNYQNFALSYLNDRFVAGTAYNSPASGNASSHEVTHNLNAPTTAVEFYTTVSDYRWLHARGLYIDYLEPDAVAAIDKAKSDCAAQSPPCTTEELRAAVLSRLPFTSINLTEIANWTPATSGTQNIVVTNLDFVQSVNSDDPVRGKVLRGSSPSDGAITAGTASILRSNSGVALLLGPINPSEATPLTDPNNQDFRIVGVATGGGTYTVNLINYPFTNSAADLPTIAANPLATCNYNRANNPNPYTCTTVAVDVATTWQIGNYNFAQGERISSTFTCSGPNGTVTASLNNQPVNRCRNFAVAAVTNGGTIGAVTGTEGGKSETTGISFPSIANGASINVTFTEQASTYAYVCTYTVRNNGSYDYNVSPASCPQ